VTLTSRRPVHFLPQRPLGQDVHFWMWLLGVDRLALPSLWQRLKSNPVLDTGRYQAALETSQPDWRPLFERLTPEGVIWADGKAEAVQTIILATGYRFQPGYLATLQELNGQSQVQQYKGRSLTVPGLFSVGVPYQRTYASATLRGAGPDAALVVRQIQRWLKDPSST
jgi:putative flavoprotein involved in K+ transport